MDIFLSLQGSLYQSRPTCNLSRPIRMFMVTARGKFVNLVLEVTTPSGPYGVKRFEESPKLFSGTKVIPVWSHYRVFSDS